MFKGRKMTDINKPVSRLMTRALMGVATIAMIGAMPQLASAQTSQQQTEDDVEEIVTIGYRKSLQDALDAKRTAGNIIDAIKAEDIGKSTDQNIAEALQRISGVSINRGDNGEGSTIVARGASANLNNITLNGVKLTSGGENSAVNLSQFSADVLSSIEVVKTPSANQDEGSLGAAVVLKGFSPLNSRKNRRILEVQGRYNSFVGGKSIPRLTDLGQDHKFSGSLSHKFLDDTLGLSIVAVDETSTTRRDEYNTGQGFREYNASRFGGGAINAETGEFITQFDYGDGQGLRDIVAHMPQLVRFTNNEIKTARQTLTGTVQYKPTDDLNMKLDVTFANVDANRRSNEFSVVPQVNNKDTSRPGLQDHLVFDPKTLVLLRNIHTAGTVGNANDRREDVLQFADSRHDTEQETITVSGLVEKTVGNFDFSLQAGHASTDLTTPTRLFSRFRNVRNQRTGVTIGYDCGTSPDFCDFVIPDGYISDPSTFTYNTASQSEQVGTDEASSVYFDTDWNREFGPFKSFEAGVKWSSRNKAFDDIQEGFNVAATGNVLTSNGFRFDDFAIQGAIPGDFGSKLGIDSDLNIENFVGLDTREVIDQLAELGFVPNPQRNKRTSLDITEDVLAGYIQGNFEFLEGNLYGDIGVRVAQTELESRGFSGINYTVGNLIMQNVTQNPAEPRLYATIADATAALGRNTLDPAPELDDADFVVDAPTTGGNEYTNVLPSLNVNWRFRDDMILRFAASQTIARPNIAQLKTGFEITEDIFNENSRATLGAPDLNPFKSTNFDISYEWYFDKNSLFSVALFDKKLSEFAEESTFQTYWRDVRSELYNADGTPIPADQVTFAANFGNTLLPLSGGDNQAGCMPNREQNLLTPIGQDNCDTVLAVQSRNGSGGFVRGAEVSFQHNFEYLPGILGNLGVLTNYTYSDSQVDEEIDVLSGQRFPAAPLLETSEHTLNLTGFYEDDRTLVRLAYNNRSDYLISRTTRNNNGAWIEGFDTLDASGTIKFNKVFSVNFQAQNLLDTVTRTYVTTGIDKALPSEPFDFGGNDTRTSRLRNTGRVYRVGARFNF